jgi:hypothetical protein
MCDAADSSEHLFPGVVTISWIYSALEILHNIQSSGGHLLSRFIGEEGMAMLQPCDKLLRIPQVLLVSQDGVSIKLYTICNSFVIIGDKTLES